MEAQPQPLKIPITVERLEKLGYDYREVELENGSRRKGYCMGKFGGSVMIDPTPAFLNPDSHEFHVYRSNIETNRYEFVERINLMDELKRYNKP